MKRLFYMRLAFTGMMKNRKLYLPYLLTCSGMAAMFYIVSSLRFAPAIAGMRGAMSLRTMLSLGTWVIALFSLLFLFYTNSFLIRRRKREFGLYNILGMTKWNISRVLVWESVLTTLTSLVVGLLSGFLFSKLAEMVLVRMMRLEVRYGLYFSWEAAVMSAVLFSGISALIFLNSLRQLYMSKPVELLSGEHSGEKPPRANWVIGVLGLVVLTGAYALAVSIKNPTETLFYFLVAVLMVIAATYALFISGSVLLCSLLRRSKRYYYQARHFVSVSSMAFRMKRNGAGLASICILSTMVLVMLSSSSCLYFGIQDRMDTIYPRDFFFNYCPDDAAIEPEQLEKSRKALHDTLAEQGFTAENTLDFTALEVYVTPEIDFSDAMPQEAFERTDTLFLRFVALSEYNRFTGREVSLEEGEALAWLSDAQLPDGEFSLRGRCAFRVKEYLEEFPVSVVNSMPRAVLVVPDSLLAAGTIEQAFSLPQDVLRHRWYYGFDVDAANEAKIGMTVPLGNAFYRSIEQDTSWSADATGRAENFLDFLGAYGGLFFIGIVLSIVFLCAAVLIIYYKQLSEGWEDQSRFDIMMKVGMTRRDIRRSINSQMLTVFALPLLFAVLHLCFAFPAIRKMLILFEVTNLRLLWITAGISVACFALLYVLVYRITSNAYFSIVSGARE